MFMKSVTFRIFENMICISSLDSMASNRSDANGICDKLDAVVQDVSQVINEDRHTLN